MKRLLILVFLALSACEPLAKQAAEGNAWLEIGTGGVTYVDVGGGVRCFRVDTRTLSCVVLPNEASVPK